MLHKSECLKTDSQIEISFKQSTKRHSSLIKRCQISFDPIRSDHNFFSFQCSHIGFFSKDTPQNSLQNIC